MRRWRLGVGAVLLLATLVVVADRAALWPRSSSPGDEAERVAALAGVGPGQTIAELGAGRGEMAGVMAKVLRGGRLFVTELDDAWLADLRALVSTERWQHVDVRRGEPAGTALPTACCSPIYLRHVFHHFSDPPAMARALYDSAWRGGRVVVIDFPPHWFLGLIAPVASPDGQARVHGLTAEDVIAHLHAAGFTLERQDPKWTPGSFIVMMRK